jgi:hypothetical protein
MPNTIVKHKIPNDLLASQPRNGEGSFDSRAVWERPVLRRLATSEASRGHSGHDHTKGPS